MDIKKLNPALPFSGWYRSPATLSANIVTMSLLMTISEQLSELISLQSHESYEKVSARYEHLSQQLEAQSKDEFESKFRRVSRYLWRQKPHTQA